MKRLLIIFLLLLPLFSTGHAETITVQMNSIDNDACYLNNNGTPEFLTDMTPILNDDKNWVGQLTSYNLTDIRMALYFPVNIPANQEITSAYFSMVGHNPGIPMTGVHASIYVENDNTPAPWSNLSDYTARRANTVTGSVTWNDATITINGSWDDSPELKTLVQQVADAGAITGLAFFVDPADGCADPAVYFFKSAGDPGPENWPKLVITYQEKSPAAKRVPWRH